MKSVLVLSLMVWTGSATAIEAEYWNIAIKPEYNPYYASEDPSYGTRILPATEAVADQLILLAKKNRPAAGKITVLNCAIKSFETLLYAISDCRKIQ